MSWDLQEEEDLLCEVGEEPCRLWVAESLACVSTYRCPPWGRAVVGEVGEVMQGLGATWQPCQSASQSFRPHPTQ